MIEDGTILMKINDWQDAAAIEEINRLWSVDYYENFYRTQIGAFFKKHYNPGETLLECGCGSGMIYDHICPTVTDYTGLDLSIPMLYQFNAKHPKVRTIHGSIYKLPFTDHSFDVVISIEVLGHLSDVTSALREMARVAKKRMIFSMWLSDNPCSRTQNVKGIKFVYTYYSKEDVHSMFNSVFGVGKHIDSTIMVEVTSEDKLRSWNKTCFVVEL